MAFLICRFYQTSLRRLSPDGSLATRASYIKSRKDIRSEIRKAKGKG